MIQALLAPIAAGVGRLAAAGVARAGAGKLAQTVAGQAGRAATFHAFTKPDAVGDVSTSAGPISSRTVEPSENPTPPTSYIG